MLTTYLQKLHDCTSRILLPSGWSFARLLRRFSIDELPQLWQVVRGEHSLIGPRPITIEEMEKYYGVDAGEVLRMKPGITGYGR
jgi:lipopolysaccharide/colanic/teichoic acid biosynthesis glycosyltransferase